MLLVGLDASIVGTAGPTIVRDLGNDSSLFPWIVSAYLLSSAAVVPIYGKVSDVVGRQACLHFALAVFALGSLLCAVSVSMIMLVISRAVQGVGGAGFTIMSQTIIGDMLAPADRGRYQGVLSSVIGLSAIAGPLFAGLLTEYWTWRGIFYLNLPFCAIGSLAFAKFLKLSIRERRVTSLRDIDVLGSALVVTATVALIMPLVWGGQTYAWDSGVVVGLLVTSTVLYAVFVLVERQCGLKAIVPLHMFRVRNFTLCVLLRFLGGCVLYSLISYLPSYWQTVHDESPTISGLRVVPVLGLATVGSVIAGQSIARTGAKYGWKHVPVVGVSLQVLGAGLLSTIGTDTAYAALFFFMAFLGAGYGLTGPSASIVVQSSVPLADLASASAASTFAAQLGGSVGVAVAGTIFTNVYAQDLSTQYAERGLGSPPAGATSLSGSDIAALSPGEVAAFQESYAGALSNVMWAVLAFALVQLLCTTALKNVPLRGKHSAKEQAKVTTPDRPVETTAEEKPTAAGIAQLKIRAAAAGGEAGMSVQSK